MIHFNSKDSLTPQDASVKPIISVKQRSIKFLDVCSVRFNVVPAVFQTYGRSTVLIMLLGQYKSQQFLKVDFQITGYISTSNGGEGRFAKTHTFRAEYSKHFL